MTRPIVAIVGRQNVGKSTLLNRLCGKRIAITEDAPGTTRDRVVADVSWRGSHFTVVDTGGIEWEPRSYLARAVQSQVETAINEADVIIFLADVRDGLTALDREIANMLRQTAKPIVLAVNKVDNPGLELHAAEFHELALGDPVAISAHHGRGTAELLDRVTAVMPRVTQGEEAPGAAKIAVVGRPGVGKSMLVNALLHEERVIVGDTPGTTRDAIDTTIDFHGQSVILIDTAGMRRRGKLDAGVERHSVIRALRAIDRADVVLLVLDAGDAFTAQDKHVAGHVQQAKKGIMLVVNKWDLAQGQEKRVWTQALRREYQFVPYAPVLFVSAKYGESVDQIMPLAIQIHAERNKRIPTAAVNGVIHEAVAAHPPPSVQGKAIKIKYVTQADVNPPTFIFFVNDTRVHFSYRRYLENRLRDAFGFTGTAVSLIFRTGGAP